MSPISPKLGNKKTKGAFGSGKKKGFGTSKKTKTSDAPVTSKSKTKDPEETKTKKTAKDTSLELKPVGTMVYVPFDEISLSEEIVNDRDRFESEETSKEVSELSKNIKANGLISPISVAAVDGEYVLTAGFKRHAAISEINEKSATTFKKLFKKGVPCTVVADTISDARVINIVENLQRSDIPAPARVAAVARLRDDDGMDDKQIAKSISRGLQTVRNLLKINDNLIDDLRELFDKGEISQETALEYARLEKSEQDELVNGSEEEEQEEPKEGEASKDKGAKLRDKANQNKGMTKAQVREVAEELAGKAIEFAQSDRGGKGTGPGVFGQEHILFVLSQGISFGIGLINEKELKESEKATKRALNELIKEYSES